MKTTAIQSIGLIGYGFVGKIIEKYYTAKGITVCEYDKFLAGHETSEHRGRALSQKIIFLAANFTDNAITDETRTELADMFREVLPGTLIVIKSTFVPGTLDFLQNLFPNLFFCYNPEFLTERTAWEDFTHPQFQVLGLPQQTLPYADFLFELLPVAQVQRIISPIDAEMLKHALNSYYAMKVTFFNQLFDACVPMHVDYETITEIMVQNPWIGDSHSVIFFKGYRGYGNPDISKCLAKDLMSLLKISNLKLLRTVNEINNELLTMQGLPTTEEILEKKIK